MLTNESTVNLHKNDQPQIQINNQIPIPSNPILKSNSINHQIQDNLISSQAKSNYQQTHNSLTHSSHFTHIFTHTLRIFHCSTLISHYIHSCTHPSQITPYFNQCSHITLKFAIRSPFTQNTTHTPKCTNSQHHT